MSDVLLLFHAMCARRAIINIMDFVKKFKLTCIAVWLIMYLWLWCVYLAELFVRYYVN